MDIIMYKKALDFISKLCSDRTAIHFIEKTYPKKVLPSFSPILYPFERATPESVGISSKRIFAFLNELSAMPELHPHSLMISKDDKIILECEFYPYRQDIWHVSHSLCKSITGLAVGLMIDDGIMNLDDKITDVFSKRSFRLDFAKQKDITIRHLLTMSAGVAFNELGSVTYEDWAEGFFSAGIKFAPGTKFMYNSMNSYMLSAAIRELTGRDMFDILTERIFSPMGITEIFWETCPRGITKGGWGLYMKIEDLMKFGKLFLDHGVWRGKQLISEKWISISTEKQIDSSPAMNDYGYGYHIWRSIRNGSYQFNGMLGQNLVIFPDIRMVIATYCGNAEFFPKSKYVSLIGRYFGDGFQPEAPTKASYKSTSMISSLQKSICLPPALRRSEKNARLGALTFLLGKRYNLEAKNVSLLPVSLCVMHNHFSGGIKSIAFQMNGNVVTVLFEEENEIVSVPFSADGTATYFDFIENGDRFSAASMGKMTKNEDDVPVFKLSVYFLEMTSVRHIKLFFRRSQITVCFSEEPDGMELASGFRPMFEETLSQNKAFKFLASKADTGLLEYNLKKLFSPEYPATEVHS